MNITARSCANCASFNPAPEEDGTACLDMVFFTERKGTAMELHRQAVSTDNCPEHMTQYEDQTESALIACHRREGGTDQVTRAWPSIDESRDLIRRAQRP